MNSTDQRFTNVSKSKTFNRIVSIFDLEKKKVLDLGCGFGEYLSAFGSGSLGITTNKEEVEEGKKRGLNIQMGNVEEIENLNIENKFEYIWANNFFEHILSPHAFLIKIKTVSDKDTVLILGVPVIPFPSLIMNLVLFRGALASNHINFFNKKTLELTVSKAGWNVIEARPFIFSNKILDFLVSFIAPHIYVVAKNNTDFVYPEKKIKEWEGNSYYEKLISIVDRK